MYLAINHLSWMACLGSKGGLTMVAFDNRPMAGQGCLSIPPLFMQRALSSHRGPRRRRVGHEVAWEAGHMQVAPSHVVALSLAALPDTPPPPMSPAQEHSALEALPVRHPSVNGNFQSQAPCSFPPSSTIHPLQYRQRPRWRVEPASGGYLKPLGPSPLPPWKFQRGGALASRTTDPSLRAWLGHRVSPAPAREPPDPFLSPPYLDQRQYRKGPLTSAGSPGSYPYHLQSQPEVSPGRHARLPFRDLVGAGWETEATSHPLVAQE